MSLNRVRLPLMVIADLYKNALVAYKVPAAKKSRLVPGAKRLEFLGENQRNIVMLLKDNADAGLSKEYMTFLENVLKACQLSLPDVAIVNTLAQHVDPHDLKAELKPQYLLLFGNYPQFSPQGSEISHFTIDQVEGTTIFNVPEINLLVQQNDEGKQLKTKLWTNLKQLFNV